MDKESILTTCLFKIISFCQFTFTDTLVTYVKPNYSTLTTWAKRMNCWNLGKQYAPAWFWYPLKFSLLAFDVISFACESQNTLTDRVTPRSFFPSISVAVQNLGSIIVWNWSFLARDGKYFAFRLIECDVVITIL
jgi:hypothetical protein